MIDLSILGFYIFCEESVVESLQILWVWFEECFAHLIEHHDELVFWEDFLILEGFLLFGPFVNLQKHVMKVPDSELIA